MMIEWPDLVRLARTKAPDQTMRIKASTVLVMASTLVERDDTIRRNTATIVARDATIRDLKRQLVEATTTEETTS